MSLSAASTGPPSVPPGKQYGTESRMPWFGELFALPGTRTEDDLPADLQDRMTSAQHPDREASETPRQNG